MLLFSFENDKPSTTFHMLPPWCHGPIWHTAQFSRFLHQPIILRHHLHYLPVKKFKQLSLDETIKIKNGTGVKESH